MSDTALVVDRKGLAKKLANKPKAFILFELLQNCWDEDVTKVRVEATTTPGKPEVRIYVEDDCAEGFQDLTSIYTLFKDSKKAPDPTKRGRFELGEKLVAAVARRMEVITTKGGVLIEGDSRKRLRRTLVEGSCITVDVRMTRSEFIEMMDQVSLLIPPKGIETLINSVPLEQREPEHVFETTLQTVYADAEGNLKPTSRKTEVRVYKPRASETGHLYEMGIPVVETGDQWHYDVQQRVPVNWERNNVPPSYLKTLRVEVLNALHDRLDKEEAKQAWVTEALADNRCEAEATNTVLDHRFGKKRVIFDASDPEGTKMAMSQGYTVIPGGALPKGAWSTVKTHGAALPAGKVTPSPKTYDPDGEPEKVIPPEKWTQDQARIVDFAKELFRELDISATRLQVRLVTEPLVRWSANYGKHRLCLNYGKLGKRWFARPNRAVEVLSLLIHEFAHHFESDHLSSGYYRACTDLGAKVANLALDKPELFQ